MIKLGLKDIPSPIKALTHNLPPIAETIHFDVIIRNVNRLKVLTDELLDMQKLEEGRVALQIEELNLADCLEEIKREISHQLSRRRSRHSKSLLLRV